MSRIYKINLEVESRQIVYLPTGAKTLSVCTQGEPAIGDRPNSQMPVLFVEIDESVKDSEQRIFRTVTTGEVFNSEGLEYIGSTFVDWYTAHVYEVIGAERDPVEDRYQEDMKEIRNQIKAIAA